VSRAALPASAYDLPPARLVDVPGGPLSVLDVAGTGHLPVLLVPGFTGSKEDFAPVLGPLGAAGHHAIAYDQRGQYESEGPGDPAAYGPEPLAADLLALVDALGVGRVHLVGHSYGGIVSRAAVLADTLGRFASLTLLGSGPAAISGAGRSSVQLLAQVAGTIPQEQLWEAVLAHWVRQDDAPPPAALPFQRERFVRGSGAAIAGMGQALLAEPDRVADLAEASARCGVPLCVVFGADDDAWSAQVQTEMACRLGAATVELPGAGHSPAVETPEALVGALLRLLAGAETGALAASSG